MASPIQATGLGSNLDVNGLVSKLMEVEKAPLTKLTQNQAAVTLKVSAYATFKGNVSALQSSLAGLQQVSAYSAAKATVADTAVASASASSGADIGTHSLEVSKLAVSHRLKTDTTFAKSTDIVGTGTLTLDFGTFDGANFTTNADRPTANIKIDAAHSSLAGVRDAINAAKAGVTASIVNDGTGNRLIVSSNSTGTSNSIRLRVADDDNAPLDAAGLSVLAYDPAAAAGSGKNMKEVTAAQNAEFKVDGLDIVKQSNTVTDVLEGTTLTLLKTNAGAPTTLSIASDTSGLKTSVDNFVKAYNELNDSVKKLTGYDEATKTAGTLNAEPAIRTLASQIRATLSNVVTGAPGGYNALAQVGITFDSTGKLNVNNSKLDTALKNNPSAVQSLFATGAKSEDALVKYASSTATTPGGTYGVNITQLATQAKAIGTAPAALTIDATNDSLSVKINGTSTTITLAHGTYTAANLAAEAQTKINGSSALSSKSIGVTVTESAGVLTMATNDYGSASSIVFEGQGSGQTALFGVGAPNVQNGVDVAGTIGKVAASGSGQTLKAANGLAVSVLGGALGERSSITFTRGIAVQLDSLLSKSLSDKGSIASSTHALEQQNKDMDKQKERINATLAEKEARYLKQFNSLDSMLSNMQSKMAYLSQQLSALNNNNK